MVFIRYRAWFGVLTILMQINSELLDEKLYLKHTHEGNLFIPITYDGSYHQNHGSYSPSPIAYGGSYYSLLFTKPSSQPISQPSSQPISQSSSHPTFQPSRLLPSQKPAIDFVSFLPTTQPTFPSLVYPTLAPSKTSSTPTIQFSSIVYFRAMLQLTGVSASQIDVSAQQALVAAAAVIMNISPSQLAFDGISRRRLEGSVEFWHNDKPFAYLRVSRHLQAANNVVNVAFKGHAAVPAGTDPTAFANRLQQSFANGVSNGQFMSQLSSNPILSKAIASFTGFSDEIVLPPTALPTFSPTIATSRSPTMVNQIQKPNKANGRPISVSETAGIVIACVAVCSACAGCCYFYFVRRPTDEQAAGQLHTAEPPSERQRDQWGQRDEDDDDDGHSEVPDVENYNDDEVDIGGIELIHPDKASPMVSHSFHPADEETQPAEILSIRTRKPSDDRSSNSQNNMHSNLIQNVGSGFTLFGKGKPKNTGKASNYQENTEVDNQDNRADIQRANSQRNLQRNFQKGSITVPSSYPATSSEEGSLSEPYEFVIEHAEPTGSFESDFSRPMEDAGSLGTIYSEPLSLDLEDDNDYNEKIVAVGGGPRIRREVVDAAYVPAATYSDDDGEEYYGDDGGGKKSPSLSKRSKIPFGGAAEYYRQIFGPKQQPQNESRVFNKPKVKI